MGYALFTARKMSLTTRLNLCNAQIMSNSERANALTMDIFTIQNKTAMEKANKTLAAQTKYTETLSGLDVEDKEYNKKQSEAEAELNKAMTEIARESAMDDLQIQGLNMQQTMLDQQRKMLETQLNAYNNELEQVGKAEEDAIKKATPSYK
jgi:chromosome segregation ATPase